MSTLSSDFYFRIIQNSNILYVHLTGGSAASGNSDRAAHPAAWVAVPPWLSSSNLALPIVAKLGQGPQSSPRSRTNPPAVNIKHLPSHSNARAVSSSGTPVVSSQSTTQYSGAELCIYSHACPLPIAPSTAARLKSLPAVAMIVVAPSIGTPCGVRTFVNTRLTC